MIRSWWFRNPKQPPDMHETLQTMGLLTISTGEFTGFQPYTVCMDPRLQRKNCRVTIGPPWLSLEIICGWIWFNKVIRSLRIETMVKSPPFGPPENLSMVHFFKASNRFAKSPRITLLAIGFYIGASAKMVLSHRISLGALVTTINATCLSILGPKVGGWDPSGWENVVNNHEWWSLERPLRIGSFYDPFQMADIHGL